MNRQAAGRAPRNSQQLGDKSTGHSPGSAQIVGALAAVVLAGAAIVFWSSSRDPRPAAPAAPAPPREAPKAVVPVPATAAAKVPATNAMRPVLVMPDGQELPLLNGVTSAKPPIWPEGRPYAEVVDKVVVGGVEYYRHKDGTMTTTQLLWRPDLGRYDATTQVKAPVDTQGIAR